MTHWRPTSRARSRLTTSLASKPCCASTPDWQQREFADAAGEGGDFAETPLHWAASSDDLDVARVLLDLGANIDAPRGSIASGTPLDNAVGYGCWQVAGLLVSRGARVDKAWVAAAVGLLSRLQELLPDDAAPEEINHAFYQACASAQRRTAEYLLSRGADINFQPDHAKTTPLGAATSLETRRKTIAEWLRQQGAH